MLAGGMAILVRSQARFSSNVTLEGGLAAVKPLPGHCHPSVSQNMDLPGSLKQHSASLPNPLSMHLKKVWVRIELYFIPGGLLAGLSSEKQHVKTPALM